MITLTQALQLANKTTGMDEGEALDFLALLMSSSLNESDGAQLLLQLSDRGETGIEVAAFVKGLRQQAVACDFHSPALDVCGTGGSGLTRYNISTTVAFICAAAGIPVAKHGNRGSQKPNGSFDLLDALEIPFDFNGTQLAHIIKESNLCFLFARTMHPAVGSVVPYRKAAGKRTIFNLAGPLANPAVISHQIIGTCTESAARILAETLQLLDIKRACVVWGAPGIDEFSVTGNSDYFIIDDNGIQQGKREHVLHPHLDHAALHGGNADENAIVFQHLINGEERGALRDMLLVNAGAALDLWHGRDLSGDVGFQEAAALIDNGSVASAFKQHRQVAQTLAASSSPSLK